MNGNITCNVLSNIKITLINPLPKIMYAQFFSFIANLFSLTFYNICTKAWKFSIFSSTLNVVILYVIVRQKCLLFNKNAASIRIVP